MTILLTGAAGQPGQALRQQLPAEVELIATSRSGDGGDVDGSSADGGLLPLDLADAAACRAAVLEQRRPIGCSMAVPTPLWTEPRANRSWPWR